MNFATAMQEASEVLNDLESAYNHAHATGKLPTTDEFDGQRLLHFLKSEEGARGFFVVLLTGELRVSDDPPPVLTQTLFEAPEPALTVLTKNLVMSAATEVVHLRNGDAHNAAGSRRVTDRTKELFARTKSGALLLKAQEMRDTIEGCSDAFSAFLGRVNYDEEQKLAALHALNAVLNQSHHYT